ncbi:single-strand DNA-binding protein [Mucilaginibacter pineti]|uniref:Single-stranded DNA-binding protein n=1 Tax=Mucilaginibacter pineti TaxID=1391627 RepID=A0A1G7JZ36_9SPHI|nr:single-stranded DNA-binding protein [Mucilaginibacter pineti]SDF30031.1 single-strand DNA-binding protein [Mucilaginibacter pineti]
MEITGRVVANAAVRTTKTDKKVTGFTIAINDSYKPKDKDRVQITTYVECSYWRNPGIAEYLTKGTLVQLAGRMQAGAYINRDGEAVGTLNFNTESIKLLGKSAGAPAEKEAEKAAPKANKKQTANAGGAPDDDDLPF